MGFKFAFSELEKPEEEPTRTPEIMQLRLKQQERWSSASAKDFRDEIMSHMYDPGNSTPQRKLTFDIEVADDFTRTGLAIHERINVDAWNRIGSLSFHEVVVSHNGDYVIHFHHPGWRDKRDDPATAIRPAAREVIE